MTDFDEYLNKIEKQIEVLDIKHLSNRTNSILEQLMSNVLDVTTLSPDEQTFIHAKLHMDFFNKRAILDRNDIKALHSALIKLMANHKVYDKLDEE